MRTQELRTRAEMSYFIKHRRSPDWVVIDERGRLKAGDLYPDDLEMKGLAEDLFIIPAHDLTVDIALLQQRYDEVKQEVKEQLDQEVAHRKAQQEQFIKDQRQAVGFPKSTPL